MVAREAAQQLVNRNAERLALDVPQRHVERAQPVDFFAARGIEIAAIHDLPEMLNARRTLADDHGAELLDHVFGAAFSDAGDALIGFDGDHVAALVKDGPPARDVVIADAGDLHVGQRSRGLRRAAKSGSHAKDGGFQKGSAIHGMHCTAALA